MTSSTPPASGQQSTQLPALATCTGLKGKEALIKTRSIVFIWRAIIIAVCLLGIVLNSISAGFFAQLVFFTTQSNFFLAGYMLWAVWLSLRRNAMLTPALAGSATLYICITGLVYNLLLSKVPILLSGSPATILLHFVAPLMAVLDWLFLLPHGRLRWRAALYWLSYPLAYLAFALIRGLIITGPRRYPYFFLDVDKLGYSGVALNTVIFALAFWLLGILLVVIDRALILRMSRAKLDVNRG